MKDIRVLRNKYRGEYWCFVEPGSPDIMQSMIAKLGGIYFGNSIAFKVPFERATQEV